MKTPRHPDDQFADDEYNWVKRTPFIPLRIVGKEREEIYQFNKAFFAKYYGTKCSRASSKAQNPNPSR